MSSVCDKKLNSYYHALSNDKIANTQIRQMLAKMSLSIIPESLAKEPIVIAIDDTTIRYISISIGYAMWTPKNTKLELAIELLEEIIPMLKDKQVILCFDNWYAKKKLILIFPDDVISVKLNLKLNL